MRNHNRILSLAAVSTAMPQAVCGSVRGEKDPAALFADLRATVEAHHDQQNSRLGAIEATVNSALAGNAAAELGGSGDGPAPDPEYTGVFANYLRSGQGEDQLRLANADGHRATLNAAITGTTDSDGGYLAPIEWDRQVRKKLTTSSPMRRLSTVMTTGVRAFSTVWHNGQLGSGWVGETAARPATSTGSLARIDFAVGEIYANPAISQNMMDDADFNMEAWIAQNISDEMDRQEGIAFLSGDGVNKPRGFLTYVDGGASDGQHPGGNLEVVEGAISADGLVDFAYSLPSPYRQGASWLMNSTTAATITKLKDGQGAFIWREGLIAGQPATLLGYPVEIDEGMPAVAAGNTPLAFGNFSRGYLINDRIGMRILRDPYTNKPFVHFYTTKRVGGGVLDPHAIRLLKIGA